MSARPGLYVDDNSGNGVTDPQSARLALASLLSGPGIISGTQGNVTGSTTGPNMIYSVPAESFATQRGTLAADGLYLWSNDGPVLVDSSTPAPSSGKRYDLIWARHKNAYSSDGFGDSDSLPALGVTAGTAASTPTRPTASVPAGALVIAECLVTAGNANAAAASITQVAPLATVKGAPIPVASSTARDALTPYKDMRVSRQDQNGSIDWYNGTAWVAGDTGWLTLGLIGGDYTGVNTMYRVKNGVPGFLGLIQKNTGNYNTNATTLLIAAGNLPSVVTPAAKINRMVSGASPSASYRGIIDVDRSLSIVAGATAGNYVDLSGFGAIFND